MGYHWNRLDERVFMAGPKPMRIEFGIHHRLESCAQEISLKRHLRTNLDITKRTQINALLTLGSSADLDAWTEL